MKRIGRGVRVLLMVPVVLTIFLAQPAKTMAAKGDATIIDGIPSVQQWYNLSCEYAAAAAITLYWGNLVSQNTFLKEVPTDPDPHVGFRGDINGPFGGTRDYGIYAEPLATVLENHGYDATVFYGDLDRLEANLAAGNPAVVWITTRDFTETDPSYGVEDGQRYKLVPGEHAVVAYGYDDAGIYLMDVSDGGFYHTDWDSFLTRWGYFDDMTLVIRPQ